MLKKSKHLIVNFWEYESETSTKERSALKVNKDAQDEPRGQYGEYLGLYV